MAAGYAGDPAGRGTRRGCSWARWWGGCPTPPRRSPSCCSPGPRAAATASPGPRRRVRRGERGGSAAARAGSWTCTASRAAAPRGGGVGARHGRVRLRGHRIRCPLAYAAVAVAGLFTPPLEGGLRALWPSVLGREDQVHPAYAHGRRGAGSHVTVGPLLVTLCASSGRRRRRCSCINVIGVLGALSVVVSPPSRAWRSAPREAHWLGALRSPGLLALLGSFLFVGIALGSITVAGVAVRGRARRRTRCTAG